MKQLIHFMFNIACAVTLCSNFAQANCPEHDFEGIYSNRRGDKFRIEQPNCSRAIVTDLQQQLKFEMRLDGTSNSLGDSTVAFGRDFLPSFPVTYSANQSRWTNNVVVLTFQAQLKLGKKDHDAGLGDLPLMIDMVIQRDEWNGHTYGFYIQLEHLRAVSGDNTSAVQRALARGINLGIKIVSQVLGHRNNYYSEYLSRVE